MFSLYTLENIRKHQKENSGMKSVNIKFITQGLNIFETMTNVNYTLLW